MFAPLGRRGERPVFFPCWGPDAKEARNYPGVVSAAGGVRCTWDAAPYVARLVGEDPSIYRTTPIHDWSTSAAVGVQPGMHRWHGLGLKDSLRPYQKEGALFLAMRAYAMLCDPLRSGKTRTALAGAIMADAQKVLIFCPAVAKMVWAREIHDVLGDTAVVLEGRSTDRLRIWCGHCHGTGLVKDHAQAIADATALGWSKARIKGLTSRQRHGMTPCPHCAPARGPSRGNMLVQGPDVKPAIENASWVIANYEILTVQKDSTSRGKEFWNLQLPGWAGVLNSFHFDICIADECHRLRGYTLTSDHTKKGKSTRERAIQATANVDRVWGITGTPMFGFVKDYWGQLDFISKGAMTGNTQRNPFSFTKRFCDAHKGDGETSWGWVDTGKSVFADYELPERLAHVKIQRPRSVILPYMPRKQRKVEYVDRQPGVRQPRYQKRTIETELGSTYAHKVAAVTESIASEMSEGYKCIALVTVKENFKKLSADLKKTMESKEWRVRTRAENAQLFGATGETNKNLFHAQAARFRSHQGAAVFVATTDLLGEGAISLASKDESGYLENHPVTTVHVVDMHYSPGKLFQAEERPFEPGSTGLTVIHYILKESYDEAMVDIVLPKVEAMSQVQNEENADNLLEAFAGRNDKTTALEALRAWTGDQVGANDDEPDL